MGKEATMSNPNWMSSNWLVTQGDPQSSFFMTDTLAFTGTTVNLQHNFPGATLSAQPWGTLDSTTITPNGATGYRTSDNRQFQITYDATKDQLTCTMDSPPSEQPWVSVALGALSGALAGAAVGIVAGSVLRGFITGLLAASTGSLVMAARSGSGLNATQTNSSIIWVANDGGPVPKPHPGENPEPYPIRAVSA